MQCYLFWQTHLKIKLENINGTLVLFFYVRPSSPQLQKFFLVVENTKKPLANEWKEYTSSYFKESTRTFSKKKLWKLYNKKTISKTATIESFSKMPNRKKVSNERFNLCEAKIWLNEIIKSTNSQTSNNSPGNDGLTAEFYKNVFIELVPILLDVYNFCEKVDTIGFTSRTGIVSFIYKKGDKRDISHSRPIFYNS